MAFTDDLLKASEIIRSADSVTIISHIDADGIASEAILREAIEREKTPCESVFLRQLEPLMMKWVPKDDSLKLFVDLGAGQQNLIEEHGLSYDEVLILDHHIGQPAKIEYRQVNCLPYGITKLSAAGIAYLVAREMNDANRDLAKLAVVGNVGDMMAREGCGLIGPAREIALDGVLAGNVLAISHDLNCYGLSTRPVHICLSYSDDPVLPGISNNPNGAQIFLERLGIRLRDPQGQWRVWEDLSPEEKRTIASALVEQLVAHGESVDRLFGESYIFPDEAQKSPLRNASEYATLLNACGRWTRPAIGSAVCRGDRGLVYQQAEEMLRHHRSVIRELFQYIIRTGVTRAEHFQWIHTQDQFPDTIVGIGAGMALSKLDRRLPIMIFCTLPDDPEVVKVSMRTVDRVVRSGIDLQAALCEASALVGGAGGGHAIAAGAYIPAGTEEIFVRRIDEILACQSAQGTKNS
ncbi:MAG: Archaea-specific RecJ-like exonuclease [Methanomicrobiales archaeon 53_19]|jgi:RecJ-like exonuclease|uniref:single-stranded-DNA-specific exonuclease RecJ n=1 Tax=Methanocalculus sp. TaxID=2004547 RepID=UPI00074B08FE|nr:DHH family phosphoesterase [Methanocalculus sp.]KUL05252.1 MAG: Archaea-specific RecJ-like exonuclease [Methanomicrobiales archaeon 53_19]HIJ05745.1 DHH family phosphoesterase [Methanocalculus sp.]